MKRITLLMFAAVTLFSACKDYNQAYMPYMEKMKDSIFNTYPTVVQITIGVKEGSVLNIQVGDAHMYNTPDANRQKVANEMGMMALRLFPADNALDKAQLQVSKDERSIKPDPSTIKTTPINLDSLRRVMKAAQVINAAK